MNRADDGLSDAQIDVLLDEVDAVHDALAPATRTALREIVDQVERDHVARRRRRLFAAQGVAAAAAGIVAVTMVVTTLIVRGGADHAQVGGSSAPVETSQTRVGQEAPDATLSVQQQDPHSGVFLRVTAADKPQGTVLNAEISGMQGPQRGILVAVSRSATIAQVASWFAPEPVAGDKKKTTVTGTIALRWHEIATFRVLDQNGQVLLEVVAS